MGIFSVVKGYALVASLNGSCADLVLIDVRKAIVDSEANLME